MIHRRLGFIGIALSIVLPFPAIAEQSLEQAASDPTASLMNVQLSDWYTQSYYDLGDDSGNTVLLRSAIPFTVGGQANIFRVSAPIVTDSPSGSTGLSDMTVFNLATFNENWGRWGVGVVGLLPTGGEDRGLEKWGLGPAFGFVASEPGMLLGLFNQNIFTVAGDDKREDVSVSTVQPILSKKLGHGWSVGFSDMTYSYDWENSRWSSLPLGAKLSKFLRLGKLPTQFSGEYEYNFADGAVGPRRVFRLTAKILFPGPG